MKWIMSAHQQQMQEAGRQTRKGGRREEGVDQGWAAWATIARVSVKFLVAFIYWFRAYAQSADAAESSPAQSLALSLCNCQNARLAQGPRAEPPPPRNEILPVCVSPTLRAQLTPAQTSPGTVLSQSSPEWNAIKTFAGKTEKKCNYSDKNDRLLSFCGYWGPIYVCASLHKAVLGCGWWRGSQHDAMLPLRMRSWTGSRKGTSKLKYS